MRRTIKISPKKSIIKGSLKADFALFNERVGAPIFVPQTFNGSIFAVNQYTHLDSDGITFKPVFVIDNLVEVLHKTRLTISVQVINPEDQIDVFDVQYIKYKWYKNGSYLYEVNNLNDFRGSNAIQFTEDQCTPAISGIYTVEVTNDTGTTVSSELILKVHDPLNTPELYGNLIFNSSGEADLDGWTPAPGISVQQFFHDMHDSSYGENGSIPRIQKLWIDWAKTEDDQTKAKPIQPTGTFAFKKHHPYTFREFYRKLQSHINSIGGVSNYDPAVFQSSLSDYERWIYRYKTPNLVSNENNGVQYNNIGDLPDDYFGSFFPSKNYLDEYNGNTQAEIVAEGYLPGWAGSLGTYFGRDPIKPNEDGVLKMNQQIDVSNIAGLIDGNVCGVDKVVGNLFAYVGTGIDSYNYRIVFDDLHKSIPNDEDLFRRIVQKINIWDADFRYGVPGYYIGWQEAGERNPIPNIYRAATLKQRSSYMDKIYPTAFDSVGAWSFTKSTDTVNKWAVMMFRSGSTSADAFAGNVSGLVEGYVYNYPLFTSSVGYYNSSSRVISTSTTTGRNIYAGVSNEQIQYLDNHYYVKHLTQDFGYFDDDWSYTSAPYIHRNDFVQMLNLYQGGINKGIPTNYSGSWGWFGPPLVYTGQEITSSINTATDNQYLASSYIITARYLNSLSILTGGRDNDPPPGIITRIPESSVLNYTNLRYKSTTPVTYQAAVPLAVNFGGSTSTAFTTGFVTKSSDWRDFNPPTHTISPDIEENKGIYQYTQRPDALHPEGHKTDPILINFFRDRTPLVLGFNCDFFAKAAALVPGNVYGPFVGGVSANSNNGGTWVENGFFVEKTVGEFDYQPPQWRYPILKKLYETSIGDDYAYSSFLSDFAILFHRLLMMQNINHAHPQYDPITNLFPIKGPIESDVYLDAISRTIGTALPFELSNAEKRNEIRNNQYENLPIQFKLASPSLYFQDKYVSYIHTAGFAGGRNTGYGPSGSMPTFTSVDQVASREAMLATNPELEQDITPLPTSGEGFQPYLDRTINGLNTRFEDAEEFIMNYIIKPLNEDLFQIPDIENLTEEDLTTPVVQVFMSTVHLFSTNRTRLAGGQVVSVGGAQAFRFQEGTGVDTNLDYRWYHRQFGSNTYGAIGVNFGKPVAETNISNAKLFSTTGGGPLQGLYINQTIVNESTLQTENIFDNVDGSTYDERTGERRLETDVAYQKYTPTVAPSAASSSFRVFENITSQLYPTSSGGSYDLLGVFSTSDSFNESAISGSTTTRARASRFPFFPSLDFKNRIRLYPEDGVQVLNAPRLSFNPEVPSAEVKSAFGQTLPMAHAAGSNWWDPSPEQQWHEYVRRALVYWVYAYRNGTFAPETGDTLLLPAAPDIELNTTMLSAEALLRLQKDVTAYPLLEYRHILTGVHDNVSRQGARIEVTPRADNQVKFVVKYIDENQEIIGQDTLNGPTVDDIFAVKEKVHFPTIIGSLIQKTCILPDMRPVPVLYKGIEMFSVTNTDIISSVADFVENYSLDGFLTEHGVTSGAIVSEVLATPEEDRDSDEWKANHEIIARLTPDRGAAAFFAVQKKLNLPKGTTAIDIEVLFENSSISRNAPIITQGDLKYEADTIPAMHTTYPYFFYEYGNPRTGVCLIKLCLYDNEFKRTNKYPQYYIPATHVWSSMKQTMDLYGPLAYLQGYSVLGRYGSAPSLFEEINYRVPDRGDLLYLQQGLATVRNFKFTEEIQQLLRDNGFIVEGYTVRALGESFVIDVTTVRGIELVTALYETLRTLQLQSGAQTGDNDNTLPGYQN